MKCDDAQQFKRYCSTPYTKAHTQTEANMLDECARERVIECESVYALHGK